MPTIEILVEERRLTGFTGAGSAWLSKQMKQIETNQTTVQQNATVLLHLWWLRQLEDNILAYSKILVKTQTTVTSKSFSSKDKI